MFPHQQRLALMLALALLVVLGMLGLGAGDAPPAGAGDRVVWSLAVDDVRAVMVDGPDSSWVLTRTDAGWVVSDAERTLPADPVAAMDVLDALREASEGVEVQGDSLAAFGLEDPVRLRVETADGARTLQVGRETAVGRRTYLRDPTSPGVIAVQGGLGVVARQSAASLWDTLAPGFDEATTVAVVGPDDRVWRRARRGESGWGWEIGGEGEAGAWVLGWSELPMALDRPVDGPVVATVRGGGEVIGVVRAAGRWGFVLPDGRAGAVSVDLAPWLGPGEQAAASEGP